MDDIRAADPSVKSLDKLIERFCGIALTRFHLDRIDLRLELAAVGDQKVDLDIVAVLFVIVSRVEEQRIAVADQLLRDRILKDHALIDCHVIMQDRLVQLTVSDLRLGKGVADQQPGIAHIALHISPVLVERQSDIRIGAVEALVGNHRIAQPEESVLIHREGGITLDVGELHALLMLREERRDLIEDGRDPRAILDVCFADIVAVQREDITLFFIRRGKAPIVFQILRHRHRHTADQYILLEEHHRLMVQIVFKRLFLFEAGFDIVEHFLFAERPTELHEVHRIHPLLALLRGDGDVLDILFDGDQRTGLKIVIASVLDQLLDRLARLGILLYLIENDQRLVRIERLVVLGRQDHEESVEIVQILFECVLHHLTDVVEVDQQITLVFFLAEFFHDGGLADPSRTFDHKRLLTGRFLFPLQ